MHYFLRILSWNETLHVSDSSSVHHQEFFTVHTAMVYVSKPVWHIPLLCVQWKTPDDGQRNCPKHAEFHSKIKFWEISAPSWFYYKKYVQEYDIKICEHPLLSGILLNTHRELPYWCCLHVQFVFRFYKLCYFTENKSNSPVEPVDVLNVIE